MRIVFVFIFLFGCLFSLPVSKLLLQIPKTLWVFWDSEIDQAPIIVQLCVQKMRAVCQKQNWTLVVLNQKNLYQYIPNYDNQFMQVRRHASHPEWKAALSDLIRLNVIAAHGGVYMDITTILFEGLEWLDRLDQVPYLLTNSDLQKGVEPECIVPYIAFYQNSAQTRDSEGRITNQLPGYEAWFIAAKKNSTFIQKWRKNHQKHFQLTVQQNGKDQKQKGYFLRNIFGADYLIVDKSAVEIIQEEQSKLDQELSLFGERKNVNKEMKILGLHGQFGPFSLYLEYTPSVEDFLTLTIQEIEENYLVPINFFVKLTNEHRNYFDRFLNTLKQISHKYGNDLTVFDNFMTSMPTRNDCQTVKFIVKGSVFGGLIEENFKAHSYGIFSITVKQRDQWHAYCNHMYNIYLRKRSFSEKLQECFSWLAEWDEVIKFFRFLSSKFKEELAKQNPSIDYFSQYYSNFTSTLQQCLQIGDRMGKLIHPVQNLLWRQKYQKEHANWKDNLQTGILPSTVKQYETQLFWVKFKLLIFEHRVNIMNFLFIWIGLILFFSILSLLGAVFSFTLWIISIIYEQNIRPLIWIFQSLRQPEIISNIKGFLFSLCHQAKSIYKLATWKQFLKQIFTAFKFILRKIFALVFGIVFLWLYVFILHEYVVIFIDGKIYQQNGIFFFIIIGQKFLKYIGQWIGKYTNILPGISFNFLYYMFLPFYYYFFGLQLLSIIYPSQNQNFVHGFIIAFCCPLLVKLIQHESKNALNNIEFRSKDFQSYPKKFVRNFYLFFSNFTNKMEKIVFGLLILILISNLRFMKNSEGYILANFMILVAKPKILWLVLSIIYVTKSYYYVLSIVKRASQVSIQQCNRQRPIKNQNNKIIRTIRNNLPKSNKIGCIISTKENKVIFLYAIEGLIIITKYILRIYTVYVLLFNENVQNFLKISELSIHSFIDIICMVRYFCLVFISFMIEIYFEKEYFSLFVKQKDIIKTEFQDQKQYLSEDLKANQLNDFQIIKLNTKQKVHKQKIYELVLSLCQICFFSIFRLLAITGVSEFVNQLSQQKIFNYQQYKNKLIFMLCTIIIGFLIVKLFIEKRQKYIKQRTNNFDSNQQDKLIKQSYTKIEPKQQQEENDN